jgi:hypothetical protein
MAYESQRIDKTSWGDLIQLISALGQSSNNANKRITSSQDSLKNLIASAQTKEQLNAAENALHNLSKDSSRFSDTSINQQTLANEMQNKRAAYDDYETALEQAGEFISSDKYITKAEDWADLDSLRLKYTDDEGKPMYESNAEFISQEYLRMATLSKKITEGSTEGGDGYMFKKSYIKDGEYDTDDIASNLLNYRNSLDKGLAAMVGDGTITQEEAEMIVNVGMDKKAYQVQKGIKMDEAKERIKSTERELDYLLKLNFKKLTEDDLARYNIPALNDIVNEYSKSQVQGDKALQDAINEAELKNKQSRTTYKNWSGSWYADEGVDAKDLEKYADAQPGMTWNEDTKEWEESFHSELEEEEEEAREADLMKRYGTTDVQIIKEKLADMTPKEIQTQTYAEKNKLPPDPALETKNLSVGKNILHKAVNKEISQDEWNSIIDGMPSDEFDRYVARGDVIGAPQLAHKTQNIIRNMWGQKLLTFEEYEALDINIPNRPGKGKMNYKEGYKKYVETYNAVSEFMNEYLNPSQQNINVLDEWINTGKNPQTMFKSADHPTASQKIRRKYMSFKDRRKFKKLRKLYRQSGLSLKEFKEKYKSEYLNGVRRLKYSHSIAQSHYKIPHIDRAIPVSFSIETNQTLTTNTKYTKFPF